jgi:hypothetical protein
VHEVAERVAVEPGSGSLAWRSASRRSTALTSPVTRSAPAARAQRTASSTAALVGTRSLNRI